jgi:hypothetical protein
MNARKEDPKHIGRVLEEVLAESGYLTVCREYGIQHKWADIVGKEFSRHSSCERIENGIVYVKISTAPWRQEAAYLKENILNRIHKDFGCFSIKDIIFY